MKKLISIIVLLAMLACSALMAIPAAARDTVEIDPAVYDLLDVKASTWSDTDFYAFIRDSIYRGEPIDDHSGVFEYANAPDEIGVLYESFFKLENGNGTFEQFLNDEDGPIPAGANFSTSRYDPDDPKLLYHLFICGVDEEHFGVVLVDVRLEVDPEQTTVFEIEDPVESASSEAEEPGMQGDSTEVIYGTGGYQDLDASPTEAESAPGTGGTEEVTAPKTVDRIALIAAGIVVSLTVCAALFTVVKEKSR